MQVQLRLRIEFFKIALDVLYCSILFSITIKYLCNMLK